MSRYRSITCALTLSFLAPATAHAGGALFDSPDSLPNACGGGDGCWTNYLRVTDLDGDDQLDIVTVNMQGLFEVGAAEPLVIYRNDPPGSFDNISSEALGGHEGQHREVAIGDIDGDGDPDIYAPHAAGGVDSLFLNNGDATFEETMIDNGSQAGAARFGDLDGDGDLDLILTDSYPETNGPVSPAGHLFINDGAGGLTELAGAAPAMLEGNQPIDVDLFDADGDFDLDILLDTHQGQLGLWLNDGAAMFSDASDGVVFSDGNHYNPAACDVDGDGDLDFWVDNAGPGYTEQLQINDGSGVFTDETADRVSGNDGEDDNGVVCVDLDYDGDFDAIVVSLAFGGPLRYLVNAGDGTFMQLDGAIPDNGDSSLWAELGDLDDDGRLDMVTGSGESATVDRVFIGSAAQAVDARPPGFRAVEQLADVAADAAALVRFAVTDNVVTDEGPRLSRAFVRVAVDGGDPVEVEAGFSGGDLFRAELPGQPDGASVEYTVCAVDRAGNEGCADPLVYQVGGSADTSGTATGADTTDSSTDTATGPGTDSTASATGASATGSSASASGGSEDTTATSGTDTTGEDGGGGCGCTSSRDGSSLGLVWAGLASLVGLWRRRRRW